MTVAAFGTYAAAKTLREAGFDERQAEAAVAMVRDAMTESVATGAAIADLKADMLKVAIGLVIANVAFTATLTVALIKLLPWSPGIARAATAVGVAGVLGDGKWWSRGESNP